MTTIYLPTEESLGVSLNIPLGLLLIYQAFEDDYIQSLPLEQRFSRYHQIVRDNPAQGKFFSRDINADLNNVIVDASMEPAQSFDQKLVDIAAEEECKTLCMAQQRGLFYYYDTAQSQLEAQQPLTEGGVAPSLLSAENAESAKVLSEMVIQKTKASDVAAQSKPQEDMTTCKSMHLLASNICNV